MSEEKTQAATTEYQPTEKDLAELRVVSLGNDIDDLIRGVGSNIIAYVELEDAIYKLSNKIEDAWTLIRIYQRNQLKKEIK